jgi:hypothetical protein
VTSHSISTSTAEWLHKKRPTSGVFWRTSRTTQCPCAMGSFLKFDDAASNDFRTTPLAFTGSLAADAAGWRVRIVTKPVRTHPTVTGFWEVHSSALVGRPRD